MIRWLAAVMAGIALVSFSAACGGGGDDKTVNLGNGDSVSVGDDLPDDFPDEFPIYNGADLQSAIQGEQDGIAGTVATWTTGDSVDDVTSFYDHEFATGPWSAVNNGNVSGLTYWGLERTEGGRKIGYVTVSPGDDGVTIMAIVGDDTSASAGNGSSSDDSSGDDSSDSSNDGSSSNDSGDDTAGDNSSSDSSDDSSTSTDDVDLPEEVDVPDDYPADLVKVPEGARVTLAQTYSSNGQTTYMVGFITEKSAADSGDELDANLTGQGYTQSVKTTDGNGFYAAYTENEDGTGNVIAVSANEGSYEGYAEGVVQVTTGL